MFKFKEKLYNLSFDFDFVEIDGYVFVCLFVKLIY